MNIYVITGAIQTGKTTWIACMLEQAAQRGLQVSCCGAAGAVGVGHE